MFQYVCQYRVPVVSRADSKSLIKQKKHHHNHGHWMLLQSSDSSSIPADVTPVMHHTGPINQQQKWHHLYTTKKKTRQQGQKRSRGRIICWRWHDCCLHSSEQDDIAAGGENEMDDNALVRDHGHHKIVGKPATVASKIENNKATTTPYSTQQSLVQHRSLQRQQPRSCNQQKKHEQP